MPVKLLIFDLDGTLIDTSRDITNALNYALSSQGFKSLSVEDTIKMIGFNDLPAILDIISSKLI